MPVVSANPFDGNDDRYFRASSTEYVLPRTAETFIGIEDHGGGVKDDLMTWISDGEEIAACLAEAASEQVAEAVGGVVYIFDQQERAEKLKAAVASLGPTDPPHASRATLNAVVKETSSVRPRSDPASRAGTTVSARARPAVSIKIPPSPASTAPAGQELFSSSSLRHKRSNLRLQRSSTAPEKTGLWPSTP